MFNTVIGVLAIRHAPPGNRVLITPPVNNLVLVQPIHSPISVSNADNDMVAVATVVPPINISTTNNNAVAVTQFIPPIQIYVPIVAGFGWSLTDRVVGAVFFYTYSNNNQTIYVSDSGATLGNNFGCVRATTPITSGKKYFEVKVDAFPFENSWFAGIIGPGALPATGDWRLMTDQVIYKNNGQGFKNGTNVYLGSFGLMSVGDILGVAVDMTTKTVTFYVNNVSMVSSSFTQTTVYPVSGNDQNFNVQFTLRTATSELTYAPPAGFTAAG
jgi:hypothetical protein